MANALTPLFEHNLWANLRLLEACRPLTEAQRALSISGVYGTVGKTFMHYLSGEQGYIRRLSGEPPQPPLHGGDPWPGIDTLLGHARQSGLELMRLAETVPPGQVLRLEWDGAWHEVEAQVVLVEAINHATEHRAHVVTTLSAHGIAMPELDGWSWGEDTGAVRAV